MIISSASVRQILAFTFTNSLEQSFFSKKRLLDFLFCIMGIKRLKSKCRGKGEKSRKSIAFSIAMR